VSHKCPPCDSMIDRLIGRAIPVPLSLVTERKRAEEALRQAQADLAHISRVTTMGELTASLAHEIKQAELACCSRRARCSGNLLV
jgi:C4-dicarboxylate-specific signal transduction histidine kinase